MVSKYTKYLCSQLVKFQKLWLTSRRVVRLYFRKLAIHENNRCKIFMY